MKRIVLICIMLFIVFNVNAQAVFGFTHKDVVDSMKKSGFIFNGSDKNPSNVSYDFFTNFSENAHAACYYNKDFVCYQYRKILPINLLIYAIEGLNKTYVKVDDNHWINSEGSIKAYLPSVSPGDKEFYITYVQIDLVK